jgi:hypothetical protein
MNLDFSSLVTLDPPGVTVLLVEFYIELPQGSPGQWHWRGIASHHISMSQRHWLMPATEFQRNILGVTLQGGPIDLLVGFVGC